MGNYLASVLIYNLLPGEHDRTVEFEKIVNIALSSVLYKAGIEAEATDKNMSFSFPSDPSVTEPSIPLVIDITALSLISKLPMQYYHRGKIIATEIRKRMLNCFSERKEVIVIVRLGGTIWYSSEE